MKKSFILAIGAAAMMMASCGDKTPKADLKTSVDSLSYAMGVAQSNGLKEYAGSRLGIDTLNMDPFFKGIIEGAYAGDDKSKKAYLAGVTIGQQISQQMIAGMNQELFQGDSTKTINVNNFLSGFINATKGQGALMTNEEAQQMVSKLMQKVKEEYVTQKFGAWKKENAEYLKKISKKDSVQKLSEGVYYEVITEGKGIIPGNNDTVKVNYEGKMINDSIFDSSYERKEPATFPCNRVIPGWTEALTHMPAGSKWKVYIAADKAYADRPAGDIKPYSTLVFTIELLDVYKAKAAK